MNEEQQFERLPGRQMVVGMRKHKWRRRLFILAILIIFGMVVLKPGDKPKHHMAGISSGKAANNTEKDAENNAADNMRETLTTAVENVDEDKKGEETIVGWMIDRIAAGEVDLADEGSIRQALDEAERELGISLTEDNKDRVTGFLQTLGNIGVGTEGFIEQAKVNYQKYSAGVVEEANEAINDAVENAVTGAAQNFIDSIKQTVGDFFRNLIPG